MLSRFFIDRPIFAWVIAIVIMLAGALAIRTLPIAQYPEIAPPVINITGQYPGASAETVADTVAAPHVLDDYLTLLKRDGVMVMVGAPSEPHSGPAVFNLIGNRRSLAGSLIGGIKETQEMLDFCAQHQIVSTIEMIKMVEINQAYDRMIKSDVKYRFVIDMASL